MYVIEPILQDRKTEAPERLSNFCKATQLVGGLGSNVGLSGVKACNFNIFALGGKKAGYMGRGGMSVVWRGRVIQNGKRMMMADCVRERT